MQKFFQNNFITKLYFKKTELERLLILSCFFSIGLTFVRIIYTDQWRFAWLSWNLFLALVPYLLTRFAANNSSWVQSTPKFILLFLAWLLFIPNSFYIITDLFHLEIRSGIFGNQKWYSLVV